jgi:hypothetical protein
MGMHVKSAIMMRVMLNRFTKGSPETVLSALPENEIKQVADLDLGMTDFAPAFSQPEDLIGKIHYSWLLPLIEKLPKETLPAIIRSLPKELKTRISQHLNLKEADQPLAEFVKAYLLSMLFKQIKGSEKVIPVPYLPETPLTPLGQWKKNELVELIEFLGLHDLAEEIRHVVAKKTLKNVYGCLSPKEQSYLKNCMTQKEKVTTPRLGLDKWSGNCDKLKAVLQTRGLVRLGKALSGENADFIWYLIHVLDTGRGQALLKYYAKTPIPGITPALSQQVVNLMNFLKKKSES